jgi:hypothetical protein
MKLYCFGSIGLDVGIVGHQQALAILPNHELRWTRVVVKGQYRARSPVGWPDQEF